jgi:hypothetical protein
MSEPRISRQTLTDRRRGETDWARVGAMGEEETLRSARKDPDNPPWTEAELTAAELVMPRDAPKVPLSIRPEPED